MQEFVLTIKVTVNTAETVSTSEVEQHVQNLLDNFDAGTAEVVTCTEV